MLFIHERLSKLYPCFGTLLPKNLRSAVLICCKTTSVCVTAIYFFYLFLYIMFRCLGLHFFFPVGKLQRKILRKKRKLKKIKTAVNYRLFEKAEWQEAARELGLIPVSVLRNARMMAAAKVKGEEYFLHLLWVRTDVHMQESLLQYQ